MNNMENMINIATIDEYGNGSVLIDLYSYCKNGKLYIKAVRTVKSNGRAKMLFCLAENTMIKIAEVVESMKAFDEGNVLWIDIFGNRAYMVQIEVCSYPNSKELYLKTTGYIKRTDRKHSIFNLPVDAARELLKDIESARLIVY